MRPMIIIEQVIISSVTSAVDDKRSESSTNIAEEDTEVMEDKEEVDKMSGVTSTSSCCKCHLPIPEERERFISRMV